MKIERGIINILPKSEILLDFIYLENQNSISETSNNAKIQKINWNKMINS
jgi:hypothetical protein